MHAVSPQRGEDHLNVISKGELLEEFVVSARQLALHVESHQRREQRVGLEVYFYLCFIHYVCVIRLYVASATTCCKVL